MRNHKHRRKRSPNSPRAKRYWQRRQTAGHHHLLFQAKQWESSVFGCLQQHPYLLILIPDSLHSEIHDRVDGIPLPSEEDCEAASSVLAELIRSNQIDCENDPPAERLRLLADIWRDSSPATAASLDEERQVFLDFYERRRCYVTA